MTSSAGQEPEPAAVPDPAAVLAGGSSDLADGEWHRLHPATPLLRGGIALLAVIGILIANLRDRVLEFFLEFEERDPIDELIDRGLLIPVLLVVSAVLAIGVAGFYVAWRMREFRVTDEVVELRSGVVFRTQRRARLDRVQGINIARPLIPRLFGAARLEISVAGNDAGFKLDYLGSTAADRLRRDVLDLASGVQRSAATQPAAGGGVVEQRVGELLAPELDPEEAARSSIVRLSLPRLLGSLVLRDSTIWFVLALAVGVPWIIATDSWFLLIGLIPSLLGLGGFLARRLSRSLRYTIAGSSSGIRIGSGLLSTRNETLPPGRIHAIEISQPLLWRTTGWWQIRITRAASSRDQSGSAANDNVVLPVGDAADVRRVLELMLPQSTPDELDHVVEAGLLGAGADDDGFTTSPRRARRWRPFSWRRNGIAPRERLVLMRKGRVWRSLIIVPLARLQGVSLDQGPLYRPGGLAHVRAHIVAGAIVASVGALDSGDAVHLFDAIVADAERAAASDGSHRWASAGSADSMPADGES